MKECIRIGDQHDFYLMKLAEAKDTTVEENGAGNKKLSKSKATKSELQIAPPLAHSFGSSTDENPTFFLTNQNTLKISTPL